ncbi:hypothetical protein HBB16_09485 [Pseudonocardia sp. MCCB 268]|nr:hypothetical protein [Pseudonocardia cytotoxica]
MQILNQPARPAARDRSRESDLAFRRDARDLINTLQPAVRRPRPVRPPASITADLDTPALSLDISELDSDDDGSRRRQRCCRHGPGPARSSRLGGARPAPQRLPRQDELARVAEVAPGKAGRAFSDRVGWAAHHGEISALSDALPHDDLEALPTEADRAKSRGMAGRNDIMVLGGCPARRARRDQQDQPADSLEAAMVRSWASPRRGCRAMSIRAGAATSSSPSGWGCHRAVA